MIEFPNLIAHSKKIMKDSKAKTSRPQGASQIKWGDCHENREDVQILTWSISDSFQIFFVAFQQWKGSIFGEILFVPPKKAFLKYAEMGPFCICYYLFSTWSKWWTPSQSWSLLFNYTQILLKFFRNRPVASGLWDFLQVFPYFRRLICNMIGSFFFNRRLLNINFFQKVIKENQN